MRPSWPESTAFLSLLGDLLTVRPITVDSRAAKLARAERYNFPMCEAMIAASAIKAGCDTQ
jgi:predicted nucleic acid-binding protein